MNRIRQILVGNTMLNINFRALQKQRSTLSGVAEGDIPDDKETRDLVGLMSFLDCVCDAAEEALGDEGPEVVFGEKR